MEQLSNQDKIHIQNALLAYIDNLYDNFSQVQEKRDWSDWEAASRLFHALELDIEDKIKVHSERSKELIVSIRKEMANRINTCTMNASVENLQKQENELLCHIVFIKKFGSKKVNDEYERIIDDVLKEWNEAVKDKTTGPLFDHSFAFAKKLISLAGSNQQKEECVNLNQGWRVTAKRSRLRAC